MAYITTLRNEDIEGYYVSINGFDDYGRIDIMKGSLGIEIIKIDGTYTEEEIDTGRGTPFVNKQIRVTKPSGFVLTGYECGLVFPSNEAALKYTKRFIKLARKQLEKDNKKMKKFESKFMGKINYGL